MRDQARPDIIVPDVGPLIQLAQAGALSLLHQVGRQVVIPDMVAHKATEDRSAPGAQDLRAWIDAGLAEGGDGPVSIETTEVGRAFYAARRAEPDFRWPKAAELSIVGWLTYLPLRRRSTWWTPARSRRPALARSAAALRSASSSSQPSPWCASLSSRARARPSYRPIFSGCAPSAARDTHSRASLKSSGRCSTNLWSSRHLIEASLQRLIR